MIYRSDEAPNVNAFATTGTAPSIRMADFVDFPDGEIK